MHRGKSWDYVHHHEIVSLNVSMTGGKDIAVMRQAEPDVMGLNVKEIGIMIRDEQKKWISSI